MVSSLRLCLVLYAVLCLIVYCCCLLCRTGPVGLALRKHCGIPILQDDQLIDQVEQLYNQIVGISTPILLQSPRAPPSLSEPQVEVTVPPITPSTVADAPRITEESSPLDNTGSNTILSLKSSSGSQRMKFPPRLEVCIECPEYNALRNWLVEHINLEDDKARFLANKLISNGLQSPIRLKKRIELDSTYLATLGFNKEEVGNIIHAFAKQRKSSQRELTTVLDANVWNDDDDDHTTTSVTSSNRAELSTNGCLRCSEPIFRLPRGTFSKSNLNVYIIYLFLRMFDLL